MKEQDKRGGKRPGAGRKPLSDPKIHLNLYVPKSTIDQLGGEEAVKTLCYQFIEQMRNPSI